MHVKITDEYFEEIKYRDDNIEGLIRAVVAVPYIDIVHDVVSFPIFPQEDDDTHGDFDGTGDSGEYDRAGAIWCRGYGKGLCTDLYPAQPAFFLVYFKGQEREVFLYFLYGGHGCAMGDLGHQCGRLLLGQ